MKFIVLGAGSFGCSIANSLAKNKHEVNLWSFNKKEAEELAKTYENPFIKGAKLEKSINITTDLDDINNADFIVYVVPSFALRSTSKEIAKIIKEPKNFIICTKGLESGSMNSGYEIVEQEIKQVKNIAILSGPTHAEELAFEKFTTIVATSKNEDYAKIIQKAFNSYFLRVYTNTDVAGVELVGAAKNILAIAAGVCDSHPELGDNAKAALLTRGLRELIIIGKTQGCQEHTFYGLTGLGDLIVTATSKHSRNRKFGELLGSGLTRDEAEKEVGMVVEGVYSVEALQKLNETTKSNLPIIEGIYEVLFNNKSINNIIQNMFLRDTKSEN